MVILERTGNFRSEITAPVLSVGSKSGCVSLCLLRMASVWAKKGQLRHSLLIFQCNARCLDTIEDGLPDDGGCASVFAGRALSRNVHVDLDVGVGVDDSDCAWWAGEELQLDAVTIKRLLGVEKKLPPVIPDEVDHKATEDSSTSRVIWKSNKERSY